MAIENEIEHLEFLIQRIKFVRNFGSNDKNYNECIEQLDAHLNELMQLN